MSFLMFSCGLASLILLTWHFRSQLRSQQDVLANGCWNKDSNSDLLDLMFSSVPWAPSLVDFTAQGCESGSSNDSPRAVRLLLQMALR